LTISEEEASGDDHYKLVLRVIEQAIDDYVRLYHPERRSFLGMNEPYRTAHDMLFDKTYKTAGLQDLFAAEVSLKDMLAFVGQEGEISMTEMLDRTETKAATYNRKHLYIDFRLPEYFNMAGKSYRIDIDDIDTALVDHDERIIYIGADRDANSAAQTRSINTNFFTCVAMIIFHSMEKPMGSINAHEMGELLYDLFILNSMAGTFNARNKTKQKDDSDAY